MADRKFKNRQFNKNNPYHKILNQVMDPELGVGIVDMGLIYDVKEKNGTVNVTMTLTTMGCPAGPQLATEIDAVLRKHQGVNDVKVDVVWDPPWTPDKMNPAIRQMLFGG
jgi:metal-sulfur cluster biosynthetic enzyme